MLSAFLLAIGMLCIYLTLNHIDRDAIWIGCNVANIYRDALRRIIDQLRRIDVNSFISV